MKRRKIHRHLKDIYKKSAVQTPEITKIIEEAKSGNQEAKNKLIKLIKENGYMKCINRYLYMNRLLEPDDIKSEFWMGVILALPKVKTDIGDPLYYLSWQGVNRIKGELKSKIGKGVQFTCLTCGWVGRLYRKNHEYQCRKCGSTDYETHQKEVSMTILLNKREQEEDGGDNIDIFVSSKPGQLEVDVKIDNEYLKSVLTTQENRVFTLIIEGNNDRDHEVNYLKKIGEIMGISAQAVNQYLKKIRLKIKKLFDEGR